MEIIAAIGFGAIFLLGLWLMVGENSPVKNIANIYPAITFIVFIVVGAFVASVVFK